MTQVSQKISNWFIRSITSLGWRGDKSAEAIIEQAIDTFVDKMLVLNQHTESSFSYAFFSEQSLFRTGKDKTSIDPQQDSARKELLDALLQVGALHYFRKMPRFSFIVKKYNTRFNNDAEENVSEEHVDLLFSPRFGILPVTIMET